MEKKDDMTKRIKMQQVKARYQDAILSSLHPDLSIYFYCFSTHIYVKLQYLKKNNFLTIHILFANVPQ